MLASFLVRTKTGYRLTRIWSISYQKKPITTEHLQSVLRYLETANTRSGQYTDGASEQGTRKARSMPVMFSAPDKVTVQE